MWRIFSFNLHERFPPVIQLAIHLENQQRVYFTPNNFRAQIVAKRLTTLDAFFKLCETDDFAKTLLYIEVPEFYTWNSVSQCWSKRKQGTPVENWPTYYKSSALGRMYTVHVSHFDCFCLRLLLNVQKGPTSFNSLKIVDGFEHANYQEACAALGLLENDNHWVDTLEDAKLTMSAAKIRELFAILLTSCGLSEPKKLWEAFKDAMSDDILFEMKKANNLITFGDIVYNEALRNLQRTVQSISGKELSDYGLWRISHDDTNLAILTELAYDKKELKQLIEKYVPTLKGNQGRFYKHVFETLRDDKEGIFFLDAPGGTGKTLLLNLLLAYVRYTGRLAIAVAVATSGIAATLLDGGHTAHSGLKLPINITSSGQKTCNIKKNSDLAALFRRCRLLVWDEATMAHKDYFEAVDKTLRDIRNNENSIFGGLVTVLAGDFRQTLPIIAKGSANDQVNACIKNSYIWQKIQVHTLTVNMRAKLYNDADAATFSKILLKIGEGKIESDGNHNIVLNDNMCNLVDSMVTLITKIYPHLHQNFKNTTWLHERLILAPTNNDTNIINNICLSSILADEITYKSVDTYVDVNDSIRYPTEVLNSFDFSGVPSHILKLKIGAPIILMRNLRSPQLVNGTRLQVTDLKRNLIVAKIIAGKHAGEVVCIPRIPIIPENVPLKFKRLQFPVRLAFAITINKSQGQTLKYAGIYLNTPCFSHGQLYVAFSRVSSKKNLFVYAPDNRTANIVFQNVL